MEKEIKNYIDSEFNIFNDVERKWLIRAMLRSIGCDDVYLDHASIAAATIQFQNLMMPNVYTTSGFIDLIEKENENWRKVDYLVEDIYIKKYISWAERIIFILFKFAVQSCLNYHYMTNGSISYPSLGEINAISIEKGES